MRVKLIKIIIIIINTIGADHGRYLYRKSSGFFRSSIVMGIGCIAPAYGQGLIGAEACKNIGKYPGKYKVKSDPNNVLAMVIVE